MKGDNLSTNECRFFEPVLEWCVDFLEYEPSIRHCSEQALVQFFNVQFPVHKIDTMHNLKSGTFEGVISAFSSAVRAPDS